MVILLERFDKGGVEGREDIWCRWNVKCDGGSLGMCICDEVRAIKPGHEFGNPLFFGILVFALSVKGAQHH